MRRALGGLFVLVASCRLDAPLVAGEGLVASAEDGVVTFAVDPARVPVLAEECGPGERLVSAGPGRLECAAPRIWESPSDETFAALEQRLTELEARADGLAARPPVRPTYRVPLAACHATAKARAANWLTITDGRVALTGSGDREHGVSLYCPLPAPTERWTRMGAWWIDPDAADGGATLEAKLGNTTLDTNTSTTGGPTRVRSPVANVSVQAQRFFVFNLKRAGTNGPVPTILEGVLGED